MARNKHSLGFFGGVIDPVDLNDDNNVDYVSNAVFSGGLNQRFIQSTNGQNSKFTANFATDYNDVIYLGVNLNFHDIAFEKINLI